MVSREELYELVWSTPMTKVAAKFSVSGSYMAPVCSILNVPRPERGYWARLEFGKAAARPDLPELSREIHCSGRKMVIYPRPESATLRRHLYRRGHANGARVTGSRFARLGANAVAKSSNKRMLRQREFSVLPVFSASLILVSPA